MSTRIVVADYLNPTHAQHIVELMEVYALDPMGGGKPLAEKVKQSLVSEMAKRPFLFTLICYVDDNPAALVNCIEGFSTFAGKPLINIHDVVVNSEYRGEGLSQRMLEQVSMIAKDKGCCKITLEVLEGNHVAQQAYCKHGFAGYELDPKMGKAMFWQKAL